MRATATGTVNFRLQAFTKCLTLSDAMEVSEQELSALVDVMARHGGYRLVPIGEALSFSDVWDGVDLL